MPIKNKHKRVTPGPGPHTGAGQRISAEGGFQTPAYAGTSLAFTGITFPSKPAVDVDAFLDGNTDFPFHSSAEIATSLLKAYTNYCKLLNITPANISDGTPGLQCYKVYNAMKALINKHHTGPGQVQLNVEQNTETGEFYFVAYVFYNLHNEIALFPLKMLHVLELAGSGIVKEFTQLMRYVLHETGFSSYNNILRFECCMESLDGYAGEIADDEPATALSLAHDQELYADGLASQYLSKMRKARHKSLASINRIVKVQKPRTNFDVKLEALMLECIELMRQPGKCDFRTLDYRCFSVFDECDAVPVDDLFVIAWDNDDNIVQEYLNALNTDSGEFGIIEPNQWHIINKNTRTPFQYNPWPANFLKWFQRLIQFYNELPHRAN